MPWTQHMNKAIAIVKEYRSRNVVVWKDATRPQAKLNFNRYGRWSPRMSVVSRVAMEGKRDWEFTVFLAHPRGP